MDSPFELTAGVNPRSSPVQTTETMKQGLCGKKLAKTYRFQELLDSTESFL
jgi:hypothetical protein